MTSTTIESSTYDDAWCKRYLPPDLWRRNNDRLDELDQSRIEIQQLKAEVQRLTPDHAHARQCRTADIEKLVLLALDNARLRADVMEISWCKRTKTVRDHLREYKDRYGIKKPPSHASVREVLIKHGYVKSFLRSNQNIK